MILRYRVKCSQGSKWKTLWISERARPRTAANREWIEDTINRQVEREHNTGSDKYYGFEWTRTKDIGVNPELEDALHELVLMQALITERVKQITKDLE